MKRAGRGPDQSRIVNLRPLPFVQLNRLLTAMMHELVFVPVAPRTGRMFDARVREFAQQPSARKRFFKNMYM